MFKKTAAALILVLFVLTSMASGERYRKYPYKSGKIVYELTGNSTGTRVLYWDDYGYKEYSVDKLETKLFGMKKSSTKHTLLTGIDQYTWDEEHDNIYKSANPAAENFQSEDYDYDDVDEYSKAAMEGFGFKKTGEDTVKGKPCEIWEGLGNKVWIWKNKNIALKSETNVMGIKVNIMVKTLDVNASVSSSLFQLPQGREIVDTDEARANGDPDDHRPSTEGEMAGQMMKGLLKKLGK